MVTVARRACGTHAAYMLDPHTSTGPARPALDHADAMLRKEIMAELRIEYRPKEKQFLVTAMLSWHGRLSGFGDTMEEAVGYLLDTAIEATRLSMANAAGVASQEAERYRVIAGSRAASFHEPTAAAANVDESALDLSLPPATELISDGPAG